MPLVRIDLRNGEDLTHRDEIARVGCQAMVAIGAPANVRFQVVNEHHADNFRFDAASGGESTWSRDDSASRV